MKEINIRELGGEIWAEIMHIKWHNKNSPISNLSDEAIGPLVDLVVRILARYECNVIMNDEGMPVDPLEKQNTS